ncbi:MAG: hypothetical protein Devi2KO_40090 [Devosia indica]
MTWKDIVFLQCGENKKKLGSGEVLFKMIKLNDLAKESRFGEFK